MSEIYGPAIFVAFLITLLEMTEVVALVFALSADEATVRHGALGAVGGTATVGAIAFGFGALVVAFPESYLLWAAAVVLAGFGVYMFRSTLRTYRFRAEAAAGAAPPPHPHTIAQFAGGFSVGAVETTEAVIVLLAITAAGYGLSALIGAVLGGVLLVGVAAVVRDQIRRIKVPWLKLGGTSLVLSFAVFWAGEAAGVAWPGGDLFLIPLVAIAIVLVRSAVALEIRLRPVPNAVAPAHAPPPTSRP